MMSSYSGGVSISQVSAFNSNPNTLMQIRASSGTLVIFDSATQSNNVGDNTTGFANFFARYQGVNIPAVPANISAGFTLLNTTGKGFIGAIFLPMFATMTGNQILDITIDGITRSFTFSCSAAYRMVLVPKLSEEDNNGVGIINDGFPYFGNPYLRDISDYIAAGCALRFETSVQIVLRSTTAVSAVTWYNNAGVQCKKDLA